MKGLLSCKGKSMSNHTYLMGIINSQELSPAQSNGLRQLRDQIETVLRNKYSNVRIYYAGSYGKGTLIKEVYDLDIVIYFSPSTNSTLKDIYNAVWKTLLDNSYIVKPKNVALRLPYEGGFHIDVVPGKAQDTTYYYASVYKYEEHTSLQTSIKKHIDYVQNVKNTIKLMKVWRLRQQVSWETFAMEITIVRALYNLDKSNYERNLLNVFTFTRNNIENIKLIDPANTNNEITVTRSDRYLIKQAAINAIAAKYWTDIIY